MCEDTADHESNYEVISRCLVESNYNVQTFVIASSDYGVPQRRVRLFFCGFCRERQPDASFGRVEQLLTLFKLKCQKPDTLLVLSFFVSFLLRSIFNLDLHLRIFELQVN